MSENRARIFLPFDALTGFRDMLKQKERVVVPKKNLTEDDIDKLNHSMQILQKGSMASIIHYSSDEYIKTTGLVTEINEVERYIKIVKMKIYFQDILEIEVEK